MLPAQLQLGKMLELNDEEVNDLIKLTVDENPALVYKDDTGAPTDSDSSAYTDGAESDDGFLGADILRQRSSSNAHSTSSNNPTLATSSEPTLFEYVNSQIDESELEPKEEDVARYIAGCLDSAGYTTRTKAGIADDFLTTYGIDLPLQVIDKGWDFIRSLDPPGVGAVDLRDCLRLQLDRADASQPVKNLAHAILDSHFDDFMNRRSDKIKKALKASDEDTAEAIERLKSFNPKPGRAFAADTNELVNLHVVPDFSVLPEPYHDNRLSISTINDMPELALDETFSELYKEMSAAGKKEGGAESRSSEALFIKQKCEDAGNFIELLKMRQKTLLNIVKAIVGYQREFFLTGDFMKLRPMVLRNISALTGYDMSVISRATSGRYLLTVAGIISLKSLFGESRDDGSEDGATALQITTAIENLIKTEDPLNPLTDDRIAETLNENGFKIARRTVAKYREKAGLEGARKRRNINAR